MLTWWQGDISIHGFGLGEDVIADSAYDRHRPRPRRQRPAGRPARVPADARGDGADHRLRPDLLRPLLRRRAGLRRGHRRAAPGDRRPDRAGHVPVDERRPRGAGRILRTGGQLAHRLAVRLTSTSTRSTSPRRQPAGVRRATPGRSTTSTPHRPDRLAARRQALELHDGPRRGDRLPARSARTARRDDQHLRQRRLARRSTASRAESCVSLNLQLHTATLVSEFTHGAPAPLLADSQGDLQALPNGDWFVGWGQIPDFSELSPTGQLLFDAHFPAGDQSYRDFRFAWTGTPGAPAGVRRGRRGGDSAGRSGRRGEHGVRELERRDAGGQLAGAGRALSDAYAVVSQGARTGFETAIPVPAGTAGPYVTVQALDAGGHVLGVAPAAARLG